MHGYGSCYTWAGGCGAKTTNSGWNAIWSTTPWDDAGLKDWHGTGKYYTYIDGELVFKWTEGGSKTQYRSSSRELETVYHFYKWSDWSTWSSSPVSIDKNQELETRTVYRYVEAELGNHKYTSAVVKPTCTAQGYTKHTCEYCGDSFIDSYVDPAGHAWDNGVVTKEPTEETAGVCTYTCATCGETKTEVIPTVEHTHKHKAVVTAPTCTEKGYTTYTCVCGDSYVSNETAALGHAYAYVVTDAPTVEVYGYLTGTCQGCGDTTYEILPALNKTDYSYKINKEPTTEETGIGRYTWKTSDYGTFFFDVTLDKLPAKPAVMYGDTDGNGKIQTNDAKLVLQYVVKMPATLNLDAADVDGNGKIQTNDAKLILQYVVKIITQFPTQNA